MIPLKGLLAYSIGRYIHNPQHPPPKNIHALRGIELAIPAIESPQTYTLRRCGNRGRTEQLLKIWRISTFRIPSQWYQHFNPCCLIRWTEICNWVLNCASLSQATTCSNTWPLHHSNDHVCGLPVSDKIVQRRLFRTAVQQGLQTDGYSDFIKRRFPNTKLPKMTC
jgi:hypothetical protein